MKTKPGEICDKKGIPIYPGDLIRSFHFCGRRRKVYYLYHTAIMNRFEGCMELVPTSELEPTERGKGGRAWLGLWLGAHGEILSGHGPGKIRSYEDRPRKKAVEPKVERSS